MKVVKLYEDNSEWIGDGVIQRVAFGNSFTEYYVAVTINGKNVTKSYCDKQNATDKLVLVTLPDGSEMQMRSNQFNQIKAIPLGAMVRIGYVVKNTWGIRTYEMRLMEDQYMRKRRISPVILLWSLTVLFLTVTIVLLIYAIMIGGK